MADELLVGILGKSGRKLPVDITGLAERLGIYIVEENLNEFSFLNFPNRKIGQIVICKDLFWDTEDSTIYTDKEAAFSAKRYAIAHEIVHFIMHYGEKTDYYEDYCIMPLCPVKMKK